LDLRSDPFKEWGLPMKKLFVGLTLAAMTANAQTSTTSAPAAAPAAAPTQTLTTEAPAAPAKQFSASFAVESAMAVDVPSYQKAGALEAAEEAIGEADAAVAAATTQEELDKAIADRNAALAKKENLAKYQGSTAPILTAWTMALKYKVTKKASVEVQQLAYSRSNLANTAGSEARIFNQGKQQVMYDAVVKAGLSTDLRLPGSEALAFSARYYLPTSQITREMYHHNGTLRGDVTPAWVLNPTFTFEYVVSPRITFQDQAAAQGSDARYRLVTGPSLTMNINDNLNFYTCAIADLRSYNIGRGKWELENLNLVTPEIGMNLTVGPVTINPALTSDLDMNGSTRDATILTNESRVFAHETNSYNLNLYATF
jgi:hypothetical protein